MHQKECNEFVEFVRHVLIRNLPHFSGFVQQARNTVLPCFLPNAPQFGELHCIFTGKAVLYKTAHFQEVRRTRRDKCGARYAVLIIATAALLFAFFLTHTVYPT